MDKVSVGYDCYRSALKDNEDLRDKLEALEIELGQIKAEQTMDKARVVYAYHILEGGRDEHVLIHQDKKAQEVVFWKMKSDKYFYEMEHYQKSNKAWQEKYDKLFQKHQEALGAIKELENEIDRLQYKKCCCK